MRTRLGLKALGLCALVVGLMAFAGTNFAQAEAGAVWNWENAKAEKGTFSSTLEALPVFELENKTGILTIDNTSIKILCTEAEFDEKGELTGEGKILLGRIKFKNCVTLLNGVISKPCEPVDPTSGKGTVLTEKGEGEIRLHKLASGELEPTVLIKPDTGTILAKIHLGEECSVGEEIKVEGELVLWDCKGKASFETLATSHLVEEFPGLKGLSGGMHVGVNAALLEGSANVKLGGTTGHAGDKWSGKAG